MEIEGEGRWNGSKRHFSATVWATEFPVSVTENLVSLTVMPETHTLRRLDKGDFRVFSKEISRDLTNLRCAGPDFATYRQMLTRHVGVIFGRGPAGGFRGPSRS